MTKHVQGAGRLLKYMQICPIPYPSGLSVKIYWVESTVKLINLNIYQLKYINLYKCFVILFCHPALQYVFASAVYTLVEDDGTPSVEVMLHRTGDTPGDMSELTEQSSVGKIWGQDYNDLYYVNVDHGWQNNAP